VPFRNIADPKERGILTAALHEYCRENHVDLGSPEYEDARRLIVLLFERDGHHAVAALKAALIAAIRREQ
jgi:hypothetical protein